MLLITQRLPAQDHWHTELELPFELRSKARLRTRSRSGEEVGLFLERGQPLRHGEFVQSEDGRIVRVLGCPEALLEVRCASALALTQAAYHLGNRHVPLQIGPDWLRLQADAVLQTMLEQRGAQVTALSAPFDPEAGAYGGGHHHAHGDADFNYAPRLHQYPPRPRS